MPRIRNVAFDCIDPYTLAVFWSAVMNAPIDADCSSGDEEVGIRLPDSQALFFQRVPEPKVVKNRAHICLEPDEMRDADVDRIIGLGATLLEDHVDPTASGGPYWPIRRATNSAFCAGRSIDNRVPDQQGAKEPGERQPGAFSVA